MAHRGNLEDGVRVTHRVPSPPAGVQTLYSHSASQLLLQGCLTLSSHTPGSCLGEPIGQRGRWAVCSRETSPTHTHQRTSNRSIPRRMIGRAVPRTESTRVHVEGPNSWSINWSQSKKNKCHLNPFVSLSRDPNLCILRPCLSIQIFVSSTSKITRVFVLRPLSLWWKISFPGTLTVD